MKPGARNAILVSAIILLLLLFFFEKRQPSPQPTLSETLSSKGGPFEAIPSPTSRPQPLVLPPAEKREWRSSEYVVLASSAPGIIAIQKGRTTLAAFRGELRRVACPNYPDHQCLIFPNGQKIELADGQSRDQVFQSLNFEIMNKAAAPRSH